MCGPAIVQLIGPRRRVHLSDGAFVSRVHRVAWMWLWWAFCAVPVEVIKYVDREVVGEMGRHQYNTLTPKRHEDTQHKRLAMHAYQHAQVATRLCVNCDSRSWNEISVSRCV